MVWCSLVIHLQKLQPVNRILTGSSTPVVTGGSYNTFVDGIPFYNTSSKRLDILVKVEMLE